MLRAFKILAVSLVALCAIASQSYAWRGGVAIGFGGGYYPAYYPGYYYAPYPAYYTYPAPVYAASPMVQQVSAQAPAPGPYCREYNGTAVIEGVTRPTYGTACQQPDGSWKIVN